MATASVTNERRGGPPWWLVLIEGILAIIVGIVLWMYPLRAFVWLSFFIGIYWFISGIFDIVSIFFNRSMWGWKLFMGIVGIIAGSYLFSYQLRGAASLAYVTAILLGFMGLFYGIIGLVRAFQGGGWGMGILGVVSLIFGGFILSNPLKVTLSIPWLFGFLAVFGGFLAIFGAFALRSAEKAQKAAAARTSVPTVARAQPPVETAAVPATPAPAAPPAAVVGAAAVGAAAVKAQEFEVTEEPAPVTEAVATETAAEAVEPAELAEAETVAETVTETVETVEPVEAEAAGSSMAGAAAVAATAAVAAEKSSDEVVEPVVEETPAAAEAVAGEMAAEPAVVAGAVVMAEKGAEEAETAPAETVAEATPVLVEEEPETVEIPNLAAIPEDQVRYLKQDIEYVEGIGPVYGGKLKAIGINTSLDLLSKGATRKGREMIAEASGISSKLILRWVNHTDLFRVKGVGSEWADLLEAAGVDTVVELAARNPANLYGKLTETNEEKKLTRQLPSATQVQGWVEQAKTLGRVVRY